MAKSVAAKNLARLRRDMVIMARDAMEYTVEQGEQEAKRTTAFRNYTGRLRVSIRSGLIQATGPVIIGVITAGKDDAQSGRSGWETPSREYSVYVELGTSKRPPHPFIHPAAVGVGARNLLGHALARRFSTWRA